MTCFIFDMDGTLIDNMHFHTQAWLQVLEELGLPTQAPDAWERRTSGVPNREILRQLKGDAFDDAEIAHWVARKELLYREKASHATHEVAGAVAFVRAARAAGVPCAVATGAGPENIAFNLGALGLLDAFGAIVGADDVKRGKPEPEIFLTAAARLGVAPEHAIVFEDAPMGLEGARRAGMRAVAIRGMLDDSDFAGFDNVIRVIGDYRGLKPGEVGAEDGGPFTKLRAG
jgi:beta-phosphoglucomutase family hydrolase